MRFGLICKKTLYTSYEPKSKNQLNRADFGALHLRILEDFANSQYSKLIELCKENKFY
jgi:hypothetical protein